MNRMPNKLAELREKFALPQDAFWEVRHGKWAITHAACEVIEDQLKVEWAPPTIIETDSAKAVSMVVTGTVDGVTKWATGEASPKNNKNAYPWAMAEKRGKDRVILKLANVSDVLLSDSEADDITPPKPPPQRVPNASVSPPDQVVSNKDAREEYERIYRPLTQCNTLEDLKDWDNIFGEAAGALPEDLKESLRGERKRKGESIRGQAQ